jgi:hypothetical protein
VEFALIPLGASLNVLVASPIDWAAAHHDEIPQHRDNSAAVETS